MFNVGDKVLLDGSEKVTIASCYEAGCYVIKHKNGDYEEIEEFRLSK